MPSFEIRAVDPNDRDWIASFITERWGAEFIVAHYEVYNCKDLPGFVAAQAGEKIGLVTYTLSGSECEIVSLDSLRPCRGVGGAMIDAVKAAAAQAPSTDGSGRYPITR